MILSLPEDPVRTFRNFSHMKIFLAKLSFEFLKLKRKFKYFQKQRNIERKTFDRIWGKVKCKSVRENVCTAPVILNWMALMCRQVLSLWLFSSASLGCLISVSTLPLLGLWDVRGFDFIWFNMIWYNIIWQGYVMIWCNMIWCDVI